MVGEGGGREISGSGWGRSTRWGRGYEKQEMREGDLQCNKTIWYWYSEEELNASVVLKEQEDLEGYFHKLHSPG